MLSIFASLISWPFAKKIAAVIGVCLAVFLSLHYLLLSPIFHKLQNAKTQQYQITKRVNYLRNQLPKLLREKENFAVLQNNYQQYEKLLNKEIKTSTVLQYIIDCAKRQNIVLQNIQPQAMRQEDWLTAYPIQIAALGNYQQLTGFIHLLLNGGYFIMLKDFKLTEDESFKQLILRATITFFQKKDKGV
jgi:Tfp pilus assembly protein PilO